MTRPTPRHSKLLANPAARWSCLIWTAALAVSCSTSTGKSPVVDQPVNQTALVLERFSDRVQAYCTLQKKAENGLPRLASTPDPGEIERHRKALANAIRDVRRDARAGDIFGAASEQFRRMIRDDARGRSVRDAYAAMQEVPALARPFVNAEYPTRAPLATVPPLILQRLQQLPDGVEYRFMGRDLILRDVKSNLIVDFVHEAVPTIRR